MSVTSEVTKATSSIVYSTMELSIRRKGFTGLPGDDTSLHNRKVGASMKGSSAARGLSFEEEKLYLPEIINVSPNDIGWRAATNDYWNNISVPIPADGTTTNKLQGKVLKFIVEFNSEKDKKDFEKTLSFEEKAEISKRGRVVEGIADYILWRYCLIYSRVANRFEDIGKSAKIFFYLYSKENETLVEHQAFKARVKAQSLFTSILLKESMVDAVLLMFDQDLSAFDTLQDKHLALEALIKVQPKAFVQYIEDTSLEEKAQIKIAVERGILHKPTNTDSYYFGENSEALLGTSLMEAVLYWKSEEPKKAQIVTAIKARLNTL